jgi:hypothetical protein
VILTFGTTASTPTATTPVTISATTPGAPAAKSQIVGLTVTPPIPDYSLTISNSPASATVNQPATLNGTLTALAAYASPVSLSCGAGAPPTCTVSPASVTPTANGAPFTVTIESNLAQAYNFNIAGTGTDAGHIAHSTPVVFSSLFTFTVADASGTQTLKAGQTATYNLSVTPMGSTIFASAVTFTCSGLPAGASCSRPQISAGASGAQSVALAISTLGPNAAPLRPVAQKRRNAPFFLWISSVGVVIGGLVRRPAARKKSTATLAIGLVVVSGLLMSSCAGSGGGGGGGVAVGVSPRTAAPFPTQQQQFSATVSGSPNTQVTWQVNGVTGGSAAAGTIDGMGRYTAPAAVPNPAAVTVSAVAQADVSKSGSAAVTIQAPTPSGTFTITVTATARGVTQNASATLVVQ